MLSSFVKYKERYASFALNRKMAGVLTPGVYQGFEILPDTGMNVLISASHDDYPASVAVIEREGYSVTLRMDSSEILPVAGPGTWYPVLESYYTPGQDTYQQLKIVATPEPHHVVLGTITVPDGATSVTGDMITDEGRMIGSQDLLVMQFASALIANETELLGYKQRLSNIENWARTAGYDSANLYIGEGE